MWLSLLLLILIYYPPETSDDLNDLNFFNQKKKKKKPKKVFENEIEEGIKVSYFQISRFYKCIFLFYQSPLSWLLGL